VEGLILACCALRSSVYGLSLLGWVLARWGPAGAYADSILGFAARATASSFDFHFVSDPISNAFSRHIEHQADLYVLEVTHGILPDAGQVAADSFQVEGHPRSPIRSDPVNVFLFYDHRRFQIGCAFALLTTPGGRQTATVMKVTRSCQGQSRGVSCGHAASCGYRGAAASVISGSGMIGWPGTRLN